jgi:glycerate 2-kinase
VTLLVAPDAFKGTYTAAQVADAIAAGIERAGGTADRCPIADGGEGTMATLVAALGGETVAVEVRDPLGRTVTAALGLLDDGDLAVAETAQASGLGLVAESERDAEMASSAGTGDLIAEAARRGARTILVPAGGSATTDGGAGAIAAIEHAGGLDDDVRLVVLCDTTTPFERAAAVFAPQKGADAAAVERLATRLDARAVALPRDPRGHPMTGAAGGLAGGLWAVYGAQLRAGAPFVLDAVGFDGRLAVCDAVITGEGRLDEQTLDGKAVGEIAARAREAETALVLVAGSSQLGDSQLRALGAAALYLAPDEAAMGRVGATVAAARSAS